MSKENGIKGREFNDEDGYQLLHASELRTYFFLKSLKEDSS